MNDPFSKLQPALAAGDEATFRAVVNEHGGLVYQTARRRLNGDHASAEDAAQLVFLDLHRKAAELPADTVLPAWLHRQTCFVTAKQVRSHERRRLREATAATGEEIEEPKHLWNEIKSLVDSAVNSLGEQDRNLVLLRFWSGQSLREAGEATGISENAAQKRITRAFESLRSHLTRYGVTGSAAALTLAVSQNAAADISANVTGVIATKALTEKSPGWWETINPADWFLGLKAKPLVATTLSLLAITLGTTGFLAGRKSAQAHYQSINWQRAVDDSSPANTPVRTRVRESGKDADGTEIPIADATPREPTVPEIVAEAAEHYRGHKDWTLDAWALAYVAARKIRPERIREALDELEKYRNEKKVFEGLSAIFSGLLARTDPDSARRFAGENLTGHAYEQAMQEIIREWARHEPVDVWQWYRDISVAGEPPMSSSQWSGQADDIFAEWVSADPSTAMNELANLPTQLEQGALRGVSKAAMSSPRREDILIRIAELPNERQKRRIAHDLAGDWARMNPTEAARWAEGLSFENPAAHLEVLGEVVEEWFPSDPHSAGRWIIANAPEPLRQQVRDMVAQAFTKLRN